MTLQDAILALSPNHYWSWATAANQLSVSDSLGTLTFTSSVNDGGGFPGPEVNTLAQRLFSDQIWTTPALNANAWVGQTWLLVFSMQPNGSYSTYQDFLGWGDPNNRQARGWRIGSISNPINTGQFHMGGSGTTFASQAIGFPQSGWHLAWWTVQTSPNQMSIQFDTASLTTNLNLPGLAPANTDQLWIQSQQPIIISHLASYNYVVTQTQMQPVAQQIVNWPTTVPINMPTQIQGGGTVDLSPVLNNQATFMPQITDIQTRVPLIESDTHQILPQTTLLPGMKTVTDQTHTDTQNIVNYLFPQLSDFLNTIQASVTGWVQDGANAISKTVGELLSVRPPGILNDQDLSGGATCFPINVDASGLRLYGIRVVITAYPAGWEFRTPDQAWSLKDLAVVRLYHDNRLIIRQGIHTIVHTLQPIPQASLPWLGPLVPLQPDGVTITVDWAPGVCGQLIGLTTPA